MLWQPSLPEAYRRLDPGAIGGLIDQRRKELGARLVILGHHYQTDRVIRHADHTGDSLKLSQIAGSLAGERSPENPLEYVVFCGVHFMAETADMLTPEGVRVILPDLSAGCSMADMAQYDDTVQAWEEIHRSLWASGWRGRIVPVTYVNSSAAIKAFVGEHGGACCTSSNAMDVFRWAIRGGTRPVKKGAEPIKVLFLPDQHLGRNTASAYGIDVAARTCIYDPRLSRRGEVLGGADAEQVLRSDVVLWAGHCSVHKLFRPEHCEQVRAADREQGTRTTILVHPECCKEVVDASDLNGSTEYIIRTIRAASPGDRFRVGTEVHLVNRLSAEAEARGVHVRLLSECQCLCTTMFRIDEEHLLWVLDNLTGRRLPTDVPGAARAVNVIRVHEQVREKALLAVERMLELAPPRDARRLVSVD